MTDPFGARLMTAIAARGPLCVGIDPHAALLEEWRLGDSVDGLTRFAATCVEALAGEVAVLKPQSAFFERFGARGVAVLERTIADARAAGALVLLDVKRGDIGSTMAAYADAYLDKGAPMAVDAITVSPYLGVGSLRPAFDAAREHGSGVFVLARTSNPEGSDLQLATQPDGTSVAQHIVDGVATENAVSPGAVGSIGLVVGATLDRTELALESLRGPLLVPGLGAQGGTAADIARLLGDLPGVLPSSSRGVLAAGPAAPALRAAAARQRDELADAGLG